MTSKDPILFYDIASGPPLRTFAPNPWKTRYALNFKRLSYRTQWVEMPDITAVREQLGVKANRTGPDGAPYHTLPVIKDPSTGQIIGDTFEIALYLDKTYPDSPRLVLPGAVGLTAAFNANVDSLFTTYTILADSMPFDPRSAEKIGQIFAKRAKLMGVETLQLSPEVRENTFIEFEKALGRFIKAYYHVGGTTDHFWAKTGTQVSGREKIGPYLDGDEPTYPDLIVGSWLAMCAASMKPESWERVRSWHEGFWGSLHDALEPLREIK